MEKQNQLFNLSEKRQNQLKIALPVFLIALIFIVRFWKIGANSVDLDEPFSIFHAQLSIGDIIHELIQGNNPPLYEVFLHYWIKIAGILPTAVRLPSLLFSIGTSILLFRIAKNMSGFKAGIAVLLLDLFSNFHLYFSHETRVYSLLIFLTTLSFFLCTSILEDKAKKRTFIGLFVVYAFMSSAHYFSLAIIAFQLVFMLVLSWKEKRTRKFLIFTTVGLLLSFVPLMVKLLSRASGGEISTWLQPVHNYGDFVNIVIGFLNGNVNYYMVFMVVLALAYIQFIWRKQQSAFIRLGGLFLVIFISLLTYSVYNNLPFFWKLKDSKVVIGLLYVLLLVVYIYTSIQNKSDKKTQLILGWFAVIVPTFFVVSFKVPVFLDRYVSFCYPGVILFVCWLIFKQQGTWIKIQSMGLIIFLFACTFHLDVPNGRYSNRIASDIKKERNDQAVIFSPSWYDYTFLYHYDQSIFKSPENYKDGMKRMNYFGVDRYQSLPNNKLIEKEVIYIDAFSTFADPNNDVTKELLAHYQIKHSKKYPDGMVVYYLKPKPELESK